MIQLEVELQHLRDEVNDMWGLVTSQLTRAGTSLFTLDKELARKVIQQEKKVNGSELQIDLDCENIFALYTPVAVDLRFLLAVLKINSNLERIGDIAEGIAKYVLDAGGPFTPELLKATKVVEMYNESMAMLGDAKVAFEKEDTVLARGVFKKDEFLDTINVNANDLIESYLEEYPGDLGHALYISSIIRKLERVGDQSKNIAEEIIFYLEAKVVKHGKKN